MTANKKAAPHKKDAAEIKTKPTKFTSNSVADQRARLLEALETGPLTTIEIRRDLDIMMPAARVWELRHRLGKDIAMVWTDRPTDGGRMHRVALYSLLPAAQAPLFHAFDMPHNGSYAATVTQTQ
ncbi:helix-turn-helix domain-containing protein [Paraburkholderia strydomiana]|uniref:helix-turn-helix domain-containing protein n=1 Tax=Paraburkholderia strydomiana TaxID=1245417 RepID=UPI0038BD3159